MVQSEDALIEQYIESNPWHPGIADARLLHSAVPVWALIGDIHALAGDTCRVAVDYDVRLEAVEAAVAYYRRHQAVIDARIDANTVA